MIYNYLSKIYENFKGTNCNINFFNDLTKLTNDINDLFKDSDKNIKKSLLNNNIKTRTGKLTYTDVLCYLFNYSFIDSTKQSVVSNYNFDNNIDVNRTSFYKKELQIPLAFYNDIFFKIKKLLDKYLNKNNEQYNVIAVDGTYSNTNINNDKQLETCLNMGYYDCTNQIPVEIEIKGMENKNKEIKSFVDYIKNNDFDSKNVILVFDRAYFSYDFINILNENKLNFVIRVKNNCLCINDKELIKTKINCNNVRFITHKSKRFITVKDKNDKDVNLEEVNECNLVTNLSNTNYDDDSIKNIYLMRWNVEVFFKLLKSNFKFACLREHNENTIEQYKKKYLIILIELYLIRLIEYVYDKHHKKNNENKKKNKYKYNIKNNNTLMINGLKKIINLIIKSSINYNCLNNYCICFIKKTNTIKDISNPRVSKIPFSKWYVKSYTNYYKYVEIIEAIRKNDFSSLNKNLKLLANNIKIING